MDQFSIQKPKRRPVVGQAWGMRGPKLTFWMHQLTEYALAMVLASAAIRAPKPWFPLVAAGLIAAIAATADGPLGAFNVVSRSRHRIVDHVAAGVLLVASGAMWTTVRAGSAGLVVGIAFLLVVLSFRTDYSPKPVRERRTRRRRATIEDGWQPPVTEPTKPIIGGERAEAIGRTAGKSTAKVVRGAMAVWKSRRR
jgi:hypothetical protein